MFFLRSNLSARSALLPALSPKRIGISLPCSIQSLGIFQKITESGKTAVWVPTVFPSDFAAKSFLAEARVDILIGAENLSHCLSSIGIGQCDDVSVLEKGINSRKFPVLQIPGGLGVLRSQQLTTQNLQSHYESTMNFFNSKSEEIVIASSGKDWGWLTDGLALSTRNFSHPKAQNREQTLTEVNTGWDLVSYFQTLTERADLLIDFDGFELFAKALKEMDPVLRRKLVGLEKSKTHAIISRVLVNAPTRNLSTSEQFQKVISPYAEVFRKFQTKLLWNVRLAETGSLFLVNGNFTKVVAKGPQEIRKNRKGEIEVRGKVCYMTRKPGNSMNGRKWIKTGIIWGDDLGDKDSNLDECLFKGLAIHPLKQKKRVYVKDLMRPNWKGEKRMLIRTLRKRKGSKGQIYFTDKSQVSAFYVPRYFKHRPRKSRAVIRK